MVRAHLFKLGLTGSIATGKSTVAKIFKEFDVPVFDADKAVHQIYNRQDVVAEIANHFPKAICNGIIDRDELGRLISENSDKLASLETIIHPLVDELRQDFIKKAQESRAKMAIFDVPLLFETKSENNYDAVLVTYCDADIQTNRALARPGMTKTKLKAILKRQLPQEEKIRRADFSVDTTPPLHNIRPKIFDIYNMCQRA